MAEYVPASHLRLTPLALMQLAQTNDTIKRRAEADTFGWRVPLTDFEHRCLEHHRQPGEDDDALALRMLGGEFDGPRYL